MAHPVVHFEVSGRDLDKLQSFYSELFGWNVQRAQGEMPSGLQHDAGATKPTSYSNKGNPIHRLA